VAGQKTRQVFANATFQRDTSFGADRTARRADNKTAATHSRRKVMQSSAERAPRKDALLWVEVVPR
jgi:hypothetical protein